MRISKSSEKNDPGGWQRKSDAPYKKNSTPQMEQRPAEIRVRHLQPVIEPPERSRERVGNAVEAATEALCA
jgi:hypothetical protein